MTRARVLFPISLAPFGAIRAWECSMPTQARDSAREIREYFIPDFSNRKDYDSYQGGVRATIERFGSRQRLGAIVVPVTGSRRPSASMVQTLLLQFQSSELVVNAD